MTNNDAEDPPLISLECEMIPLAPGTPASPRPPGRQRETELSDLDFESRFHSFDCVTQEIPPGTLASPRPPGRPRNPDYSYTQIENLNNADNAFAQEVADRVLEYAKNRQAGLSAEQLAALVQQLISRRSA